MFQNSFYKRWYFNLAIVDRYYAFGNHHCAFNDVAIFVMGLLFADDTPSFLWGRVILIVRIASTVIHVYCIGFIVVFLLKTSPFLLLLFSIFWGKYEFHRRYLWFAATQELFPRQGLVY